MKWTFSNCTARLVARTALTAMFLLGLSTGAEAQKGTYTVEDLGALPGDSSSIAWGINEQGDVVGWSNGPDGTRAFVYRDAAGMVALPGLANRPRTIAKDINDLGDIVGTADAGGVDLGHAVLWTGGAITDLGTLPGGQYSEANGINNNGEVVGSAYTSGGLEGIHAFVYTQAEGMIDLTPGGATTYATDINDAGQVTGYKYVTNGYHAYRLENGSFTDLGVVPGLRHSYGWAINAWGQVAGASSSATGNAQVVARSTGAGIESLGGVGQNNIAYGINADGDVVGQGRPSAGLKRAFLYTDKRGLQDLNTLIDPSLGWMLLAANDINDAGQIVGYAFNNFSGQTHAVRLQPVTGPPPECTVHCLRATDIELSLQASGAKDMRISAQTTVMARVTVQDENGNPMSGALVVGSWSRSDGSLAQNYGWTDSNGIASFGTFGPRYGTYTFEVNSIQLSLYTFNPSESILSQSMKVH